MSKKTILAITAILSILYGAYYFGLPFALNQPKFESFLVNKIEKNTGYKVRFENPVIKTGLLPSIKIKADEFYILNDDNSKALSVSKPDLKIALLPLVLRHIEIKHLNAESSFAFFSVEKDSQLKLGDYAVIMNNKPKFPIKKANILIKDYKIHLNDKQLNKNFVLEGVNLDVDRFEKDKSLKASSKSKLSVDNKVSDIEFETEIQLPLNRLNKDKLFLNAEIKDMDLSAFSAYIKAISKGKYTSTRGILNLSAHTVTQNNNNKTIISDIVLDNFGLMNEDLAQATYCDGKLTINSNISTIHNGIHIDKLSLNADKIDFSASGDITKLNSKMPDLNIRAILNKSRSENIITLLPGYEKLLPEFNFYLLKKHILYADVMGNVEIKGQANQPEMFGNVLIDDAYLIKRIPDTKEGARVKLSLNKQIMTLDAHVTTDPKEEINVNGKFKLFVNRNSDLYIKSSKNINLAKAQAVVMPLHNILKFEIGPAEMMTLSGFGNMDMHAGGSKTDPHAWGRMNFHNAAASFNDIKHITINNVAGSVNFNDKNVTFKTDTAFLHGLPVKVQGKASLAGGMDVVATANGQDTVNYIKTIKDSPILKELQEVIKPIDTISGKADLYLNLTGNIKSGDEIIFNENLFAKGHLDLHDVNLTVVDFPALFKKTNGRINFVNNDGDFNASTTVGNSVIKTNGIIKNEIITAKAYSNKFNAGDGLDIAVKLDSRIPYIKDLKSINTAFSALYKGKADGEIHFEGLSVNGKIFGNSGSKQPFIVNNGTFNLKNLHLTVSPLRGSFKNNPFTADKVEIHNMFSQKELLSGNFTLKDFDINTLNDFDSLAEIYPQYKEKLKDFNGFRGKINIASKIKNNKIRLFTKLNDTSFVYIPKHLRIKIQNGHFLLNDNTLYLSNINSFVGRMPLFLSGKVMHVTETPFADLYINAKPTQEFFDQFFNNKAVYPIKVKGDINCSSKIYGPLDRISAKTELKLDEASSLYYMGAAIGDETNPVKIYLDNIYTPKYLKINQFRYDKIIASQNNKDFPNTQLIANGTVEFIDNNNVKFNNFRIKTQNPTDAKVFNIIFRKPLMKQGVFTSDLLINGTSLKPKILGQLDVTSIDVPFFDATVNDIHLDFKKDIVNITSKANILTNKINLEAQMLNNLTLPVVFNNLKFHFDNLDLNKITESLQDYEADMYKQQIVTERQTKDFDPSNLMIKKASVTADKIKLKALEATDFNANMTLDDSMLLDVANYSFALAEGNVSGNLQYNLLNKNVKIYSQIKNSNAQIISESLFDLKGQMYGLITGDMEFLCNGRSQAACLNTLSGKGNFIVADGRMPKLGSLEYLLKAANLAKSGITGLSINGIIDLITPLKTGEFSSISGSYIVEDGVAKDINVYSKGKDLNLYLNGSYNVVTSIADMKVYGTLSNNITNVFGKLKNASLNTLLNTIPLLNKNELSPELESQIKKIPNYDVNNNIFRIFAVDIDGDINGINYVKSFKWVK